MTCMGLHKTLAKVDKLLVFNLIRATVYYNHLIILNTMHHAIFISYFKNILNFIC